MSKKILSLISVLFLVSVLSVSCSNKDKTGDGGTTTQGIAKHAGTWDFKEDSSTGGGGNGTIMIGEDGSVSFLTYKSKDVTDKGNETYDIVFTNTDGTLTLRLKFSNETNGTYEAKLPNGTQHIGTLTKQQ